jgi:hypothetical protein
MNSILNETKETLIERIGLIQYKHNEILANLRARIKEDKKAVYYAGEKKTVSNIDITASIIRAYSDGDEGLAFEYQSDQYTAKGLMMALDMTLGLWRE